MGGKAIGDERKKLVTRRQAEAKAAMRRYIDDVTFQVAKDSRDRLRAVQRDLRDHFTAQADQLKRSLLESQQAAERAVKASRAEREARLAEIAKELEQLDLVRRQARALLPQPAATKARRREADGQRDDHARRRHPAGAAAGDRRPPPRAGHRPVAARPAAPAGRAAAGRHRRQGEGGQVDAAQRAGRRAGGADRRGRVHPRRHLVPRRHHAADRAAPARRASRGRCPCAGTTAR